MVPNEWFQSFWFGFTRPVVALPLVFSRPKLLFWGAVPMVLTLAIYIFLITALYNHIYHALFPFVVKWGWDPSWWFFQTILVLLKLTLLLISGVTFSFSANLITCPFNDFLAEEAERYTQPALELVPTPSFWGRFRLIRIDILKTIVAFIVFILSIFISWIPILNFVAVILGFLTITFQYISYPQTRRGQGTQEGVLFLRRHFFACLGFGIMASFLLSIPVISVFCIPLAVVGGTLLFARYDRA